VSKELSVADSEFIFEHFDELTDGPFADLASALREIKALPETLAPKNPPILPSQVLDNVRVLGRATKRTAAIAIIVTSVAVASTLTAAALTGVGPKPIVHFAKSAVKSIEDVTKKIFNISVAPTTTSTQAASPAASTEDPAVTQFQAEQAPSATIPQNPAATVESRTPAPTADSHPVQSARPVLPPTTTGEHEKEAVKTPKKSESSKAPESQSHNETTKISESSTSPESGQQEEGSKAPEAAKSAEPTKEAETPKSSVQSKSSESPKVAESTKDSTPTKAPTQTKSPLKSSEGSKDSTSKKEP